MVTGLANVVPSGCRRYTSPIELRPFIGAGSAVAGTGVTNTATGLASAPGGMITVTCPSALRTVPPLDEMVAGPCTDELVLPHEARRAEASPRVASRQATCGPHLFRHRVRSGIGPLECQVT